MSELPRAIVGIDDEILVEYGKFALQVDPLPDANDYPFNLDSQDELVVAGPGGAVFSSEFIDHYAATRVEIWTAQPVKTSEGTEWDRTGEAAVPIGAQAILRLRSQFGGWTPAMVQLDDPGVYHIRAHKRRIRPPAPDEPLYHRNLERWLIQLWRDMSSM